MILLLSSSRLPSGEIREKEVESFFHKKKSKSSIFDDVLCYILSAAAGKTGGPGIPYNGKTGGAVLTRRVDETR